MMSAPQLTCAELAEAGIFDDPYPLYAQLRAQPGLVWVSQPTEQPGGGFWLIARYADVLQTFRVPHGLSKELRRYDTPRAPLSFNLNLLFRDGADHARLRHMIKDFFVPQAIAALRPLIEVEARRLANSVVGRSECDLMTDLAEPLPLMVMARIFGVPESDLPQIRAWSKQLSVGFDGLREGPELARWQQAAIAAFYAYVDDLIRAKQAQPDAGLISHLVHTDRALLRSEELRGTLVFLLFAGHETTVGLIGSLLWLLLSHPAQWQQLQAQPELARSAVEEALRFESPGQRGTFRVTTAPLEIGGQQIEPLQRVAVLIGSANHDDAVFADAEHFDIRRSPNPHLAFGTGKHNCLGKGLARLEAEVALQVMLEILPKLTLAESSPQWQKNSFFRGLERLPVRQTA